MKPRRLAFAVITVCLSLLITLALVEIGLRAAGWVHIQELGKLPNPDLNDPKEIRILCLGESTTSPETGADGADYTWPYRLQIELQKQLPSYRFKIINAGYPGLKSAYFEAQIDDLLLNYRPHAVIAMIGINDLHSLKYLDRSGWRSLRTVKAAYWAADSIRIWRTRRSPEVDHTRDLIQQKVAAKMAREADNKWRGLKSAEAELDRDFPDHRAWTRLQFAEEIERLTKLPAVDTVEQRSNSDQALELAFQYTKEALRLDPLNERALLKMAYLASDLRIPLTEEIRTLIRKSIASGVRPPPDLIHAVVSAQWTEAFAGTKLLGAEADPETRPIELTKRAYRRVADATREAGAVFLAMQYPTGNLSPLKAVFADQIHFPGENFCEVLYFDEVEIEIEPAYQDILFISNGNLKTLATPEKYADYFTDRFGRNCGADFGHTTPLGHEVIAANAAAVIQDNWERIAKRSSNSAFFNFPSSPRGNRGSQHN